MTAHRFQSSRKAGFRQPQPGKRCTRPSNYGNPFEGQEYTREESLVLFAKHLRDNPDFTDGLEKFKYLGCYCRLDQACHVDILLQHTHCRACVHMGNCGSIENKFPCSDFEPIATDE